MGLMTTVALIPGAGGMGWNWHRVGRELQDRGHEVVVLDFAAQGRVGLPAYAEAVLDAVAGEDDVALVGLSMGAFTMPLVCQRISVRMLMFVNAMIPQPGETPGQWWGNVHSEEARRTAAAAGGYSADFDVATYFLHDIPKELLPEMEVQAAGQLDERFDDPCDFTAWPPVPIHVVSGAEDRFFPLALQQRVARDRLGVEPIVVPGGHLAPLSHPSEIAAVIADRLAPA
jgi:pimeloyl-ACP methyl ester carboxylesterase